MGDSMYHGDQNVGLGLEQPWISTIAPVRVWLRSSNFTSALLPSHLLNDNDNPHIIYEIGCGND